MSNTAWQCGFLFFLYSHSNTPELHLPGEKVNANQKDLIVLQRKDNNHNIQTKKKRQKSFSMQRTVVFLRGQITVKCNDQ